LNIHNRTISEVKELLGDEEKVSEQLLAAMEQDSRIGIQKLLRKYYRKQEAFRREKQKADKLLQYEKTLWAQGYKYLGGIDEAGRGPLAGPVVSACVILPKGLIIPGIDDSKKLTAVKREELFEQINKNAVSIGVGIIENSRIDTVNIYNATKEAMVQAVNTCKEKPDFLLLDAMRLQDISLPQLSVIKGDSNSQSIAAASIVAKVTRDRIMEGFSKLYPLYGFEKHKGYGTKEHIKALHKYGLSPVHRKSFLKNILSKV
jgi:ribonuclease HII